MRDCPAREDALVAREKNIVTCRHPLRRGDVVAVLPGRRSPHRGLPGWMTRLQNAVVRTKEARVVLQRDRLLDGVAVVVLSEATTRWL